MQRHAIGLVPQSASSSREPSALCCVPKSWFAAMAPFRGESLELLEILGTALTGCFADAAGGKGETRAYPGVARHHTMWRLHRIASILEACCRRKTARG